MTTQAFPDIDGSSANDLLNITVEAGAVRIAQFECTGTVTIARASEEEHPVAAPIFRDGVLLLPSRYISRDSHCTIEALNGSRLRIVDHESTNGTQIDGRFIVDEVVASTPCRVQLHPFELLISRHDQDGDTRPLRSAHETPSDLQIDPETGAIRTPEGHVVSGLTPVQRELLEALIRCHPDWMSSAELATIAGGTRQL